MLAVKSVWQGVRGGGVPPPPDPDLMRGKMTLQKEILIRAIFGAQSFGFQTPTSSIPLSQTLARGGGGMDRHP